MSLIINGQLLPQSKPAKVSTGGGQLIAKLAEKKKAKKTGHVTEEKPPFLLNEPGQWRVAHILYLLDISHSAFYARRNRSTKFKPGLRFPNPDGHDGRPYWNTATVKSYVDGKYGKNMRPKGKVIEGTSPY